MYLALHELESIHSAVGTNQCSIHNAQQCWCAIKILLLTGSKTDSILNARYEAALKSSNGQQCRSVHQARQVLPVVDNHAAFGAVSFDFI